MINKLENNDQDELSVLIEKLCEYYFFVSSFLPEFMTSALLRKENYKVDFIKENAGEKSPDLVVDDIKFEIKTIHDDADHSLRTDESLVKEIWCPLKRKKWLMCISETH